MKTIQQFKKVIGIDPGTKKSGVACYDEATRRVLWSDGELPNERVLDFIKLNAANPEYEFALERIEALYGRGGVVGMETVKTIQFCGVIIGRCYPRTVRCLSPAEVRQAVCGTAKSSDSGVTQALIDKVGPKGTKKNPGPTFGVSKHAWRGLAVAYASSLVPTHPE